MKRFNGFKPITRWGAIGLVAIYLGIAPITLLSQPAIAKTRVSRKIRWKPPTPPRQLGIPGSRGQGGGQRSDCQAYDDLQALVPLTAEGVAWGQTVSQRPTLWFYSPNGLAANLTLEVTLRQTNGEPVAKQRWQTQAISPGTIRIPLPEATKLNLEETYRWDVAIYCDPDHPDQPVIRQGYIQRITIADRLPCLPIARAEALAERGIWYDALTVLGDAMVGNRPTAESEAALEIWQALLTAAQLQPQPKPPLKPLQDCC
jgi:hypothetical protein